MSADTNGRRQNIPAAVRRRVSARFLACFYCGDWPDPRFTWGWTAYPVRLEVDHVVPRHMGGPDDESNLVMACSRCNRAKQEKPVAVFVHDLRAYWTRFRLWGGRHAA
jgi:5-methylcytosine-specific restriction endonuclease McrA